MLFGGGPNAIGSKRFFASQLILKLQAAVDVAITDDSVPVDTTVETVFVTVTLANMVVSLRTVAVVVITVGWAEEVDTGVPFEVYVALTTTMDVIDITVWTGTLATVLLPTTVSKVVKGRVTVPVTDNGGPIVGLLSGEAVALVGWSVASMTVGEIVGKGWTGGLPSVAIVVMIDPLVFPVLATPVLFAVCVADIEVNVTVSA